MLTAHFPSGYCLAKGLRWRGGVFVAAVVGSVFPDLDLIFFYLVDLRAIHHHRYWVHVPLFWAIALAIAVPLTWRSPFRRHVRAFLAGILLHLMLDSINGGILWGVPFCNQLWALVKVPASQTHWALSYLLHWTFALEIVVWAWALHFYINGRKRRFA